MHAFCGDESVLGAPFFVMSAVPGRVLGAQPDLTEVERRELLASVNQVLADLHSVDYKAVGLDGSDGHPKPFGKTGNPGGYVARQLRTWGRNYDTVNPLVEAAMAKPELTAGMARLRTYLADHMVQTEPTCIVHGDVGLHNFIIHPTKNEVAALIDWEIATLGHPMVDVNYFSRAHFEANSEEEWSFVTSYFEARTRQLLPISRGEWRYFGLMNHFRNAAIVHGVGARSLSGSGDRGAAADARAQDMLRNYEASVTAAVEELDNLEGGGGGGAQSPKL
jgi:aminoglycoside phosphotransferase (APT) family kinase protein